VSQSKKGIHHISIIAGNAQTNADFYVHKLGMRMVLKTVNQDDPSSYHLFYANGKASPGSSITFFPWPVAVKGDPGTGQNSAISFGVPPGSENFWLDRFESLNIPYNEPVEEFGRSKIEFEDPDGLTLNLVFDEDMKSEPGWAGGGVPEEHSIRGFWSATLTLVETESTAEILTDVLGFAAMDSNGNMQRYQSNSKVGRYIILEETGEYVPTKSGRGIVHHVAFRAKDENELLSMREQIQKMGLQPTEIIDRHVFKSVYYQTPGGVLFEMATDGPGYKSVIEDDKKMGKELFLPPWLESKRDQIEGRLPKITV